MDKHLKILKKYNANVETLRPNSKIKLAEILFLCESKNIKLQENVFIKKGISKNTYVCYYCDCGSKAESPTSNFLDKKVFACKKCNAKKNNKQYKATKISDIFKLIKSKGYEIVSHDYVSNLTESTWTLKCKNNHVFTKKGNTLKSFNCCPKCFFDSYEELLFRKLIENHYQKEFNKSHPEWLISSYTNRTLELDMYNKELRLAFEYNGIQHYEPIYGQKRFNVSKRNDEEKNKLCIENNVRLISIKYLTTKSINNELFITGLVQALKAYNIIISDETIKKTLTDKLEFSNKTDSVIKEIKKTLKKQNREWISGTYINSKSKLNIKCLYCNNEQELSIHTIKNYLNSSNKKRCSKCPDKFKSKKTVALLRHTKISKIICEKRNFVFHSLQLDKSGHVSGFWHLKENQKTLFGIKQYRREIYILSH